MKECSYYCGLCGDGLKTLDAVNEIGLFICKSCADKLPEEENLTLEDLQEFHSLIRKAYGRGSQNSMGRIVVLPLSVVEYVKFRKMLGYSAKDDK